MSKQISVPEIFTAEVAAGGPSIDWTRKIFFSKNFFLLKKFPNGPIRKVIMLKVKFDDLRFFLTSRPSWLVLSVLTFWLSFFYTFYLSFFPGSRLWTPCEMAKNRWPTVFGHFLANNLKDLDETWSEVRQNGYKSDAKPETFSLSHSGDI